MTERASKKLKGIRSQIATYEKRREKYKQIVIDHTYKIKRLNQQMKCAMEGKLSKKEDLTMFGIKCMEEFNGVKLKHSFEEKSKLMISCRNMLAKWVIDNSASSVYLANYLGFKNSKSISGVRRAFNRSFDSNPSNKTLYLRFKNFVEEKTKENENSNLQTEQQQTIN